MDTGREAKVAELFRLARGLDPADRAAFLDDQAGVDEALKAEVLDLIARVEEASRAGFLAAETREDTELAARRGPAPRPPRLYQIDMFQGSGPTRAVDLPAFLKGRLRLAVAILLAAFSAFFAFDLAGGHFAEPENGRIMQSHLLVVATSAAVLGALVWPGPRRLGTLRAMELGIVGAISVFFAHFQWNQFSVDRWRGLEAIAPRTDVLSLTVDSCVLRWFALQVSYGFFLPNTWRRCAGVVLGLGACPLAVLSLVGLGEGTLDQLVPCLGEMGIWMAIGGAIGIYGSYKLTQLRARSAEARQVGPYTLVRPIGAGGMGEVYLARHALLRRPCAVKLIRARDALDRETLRRFELEAQATARLMHPHTIRLFDFGSEADGTFYCTMEYLPGLNLHELVREHGPLPPARVVHLLGQVCGALSEAHGLGLIHRDIKPGNLIVGRLGGIPDFVKLLDFGLVQAVAPVPVPATGPVGEAPWRFVAGTLGYLSPEQAAGLEAVDPRSDLYSLGAVGHFLLTGRPPAGGRANLVGTPGDLAGVIGRCLEPDPARRFADARTLAEALAACQCAGEWAEPEAADWWRDHPIRSLDPDVDA